MRSSTYSSKYSSLVSGLFRIEFPDQVVPSKPLCCRRRSVPQKQPVQSTWWDWLADCFREPDSREIDIASIELQTLRLKSLETQLEQLEAETSRKLDTTLDGIALAVRAGTRSVPIRPLIEEALSEFRQSCSIP